MRVPARGAEGRLRAGADDGRQGSVIRGPADGRRTLMVLVLVVQHHLVLVLVGVAKRVVIARVGARGPTRGGLMAAV